MATEKKVKTKEYIAAITKRVGSNPDGTPRHNFVEGQPIALSAKEVKSLKQYIK